MTENKITVERSVNATSDAVFEVLTNPENHARLDGSGFVRSDEKSDRIESVGDMFTMNMSGDHMNGDYQSDNHVTGFETNKLVSWKTAPAGTEPPGWEWVWELISEGSETTLVRLTYDWSKVTDPDILKKISFPLIHEDQLKDSLVRLDEAVTGS
ncbi:MAG: SRPBCC domain-containing protein [Nocardioides sp.]|nr:SRPBCC domain-containing protein [Nocardioides sp.]